MKIFHLSDLHLGKRVCSQSLIEDQKHILKQITEQIRAERPNAVMIAGDVYDRSLPPEDAVELFDDFLYELSTLDTKVLMISGNHDSAERLAFGGRIFNKSGIYISPEFDGKVTKVSLPDEHGEVDFYLLPFVFPAAVRRAFPDEKIEGCTDALRVLISEMNVDTRKRSVLIAHQFVTGAQRTEDSESFSVGTAENVDVDIFEPFDYVALGHLHRPQSVGRETVRYCGTPMKYSFAEVDHKKSITVLELAEKGNISIREIPLVPLRDWRQIEGKLDELIQSAKNNDYIKVILTDEEERYNAFNDLRTVFPNILQLEYERTQGDITYESAQRGNDLKNSPIEVFAEFFKNQNGGNEMNARQAEVVREIFEEITGGKGNETDQT